jgi:hypothetical protein
MTATARETWGRDTASAETSDAITARGIRSSNVIALFSAHTAPRAARDFLAPEASTSPAFEALRQLAWEAFPRRKAPSWAVPVAPWHYECWHDEGSLLGFTARGFATKLFASTFAFPESPPAIGAVGQVSIRTCVFGDFQDALFSNLVTTGSSWMLGGISEVVNWSRGEPLIFIDDNIIPLSAADPLAPARHSLEGMPATGQRERAIELLDDISTALEGVQHVGTMRAFESEGGATLLEWFAPHRRLGFSIDPDPAHSGWFLVSDSVLGDLAMSGSLSHPGVKVLVDIFSNLDLPRP